jgi:DNA invertase Pin-like site-specific DNA recombinase
MAQHEREIISARTKAALPARRARGLPLGTPRDLSAYVRQAAAVGRASIQAKAKKHATEVAPEIQTARHHGCTSLRQVAAWLNDQGVGYASSSSAWRSKAGRAPLGAETLNPP